MAAAATGVPGVPAGRVGLAAAAAEGLAARVGEAAPAAEGAGAGVAETGAADVLAAALAGAADGAAEAAALGAVDGALVAVGLLPPQAASRTSRTSKSGVNARETRRIAPPSSP